MPPYIALTPATDTHEIPRWTRGIPLAEQETTELILPLRPPASAPPTRRPLSRARAFAWPAAVTVGAALAHLAQVAS